MKVVTIAALFALGTGLSGCASIIKGSSQTISINTGSVRNVPCTLSSERGRWRVVAPGRVRVKRSKEDIQVRCNKSGYQETVDNIESDLEPWVFGNILAGGLIGLGVDASTGAMNQYPRTFMIEMDPEPGLAPAPARNLLAPNS
jgi:hypothetical protein